MEWMQEQGTVAAELALETVREWTLWLTEVERWLLPHFARREARHRAWAYIRGLLSPVERKNGWQLAEVNGDATPYGVQHLLGRARWDDEAVRDALRTYLVEHLGEPQSALYSCSAPPMTEFLETSCLLRIIPGGRAAPLP